jgi:hypothetical protein
MMCENTLKPAQPAAFTPPRSEILGGRSVRGMPCELELVNGDFFAWPPVSVGRVDAVVGNPPFVRYQRFDDTSRKLALASALRVGVHSLA